MKITIEETGIKAVVEDPNTCDLYQALELFHQCLKGVGFFPPARTELRFVSWDEIYGKPFAEEQDTLILNDPMDEPEYLTEEVKKKVKKAKKPVKGKKTCK